MKLEPFGEFRADYRAAVMHTDWMNANTRRRRISLKDTLERFNPFIKESEEKQRLNLGRQLASSLISAARSLGFKVHDKRKK